MIKAIFKEPLLYFFVVASILFVINLQKQAREEQILVDAATITHLIEQRAQLEYGSMDTELKQELVDRYIDNEVLWRKDGSNFHVEYHASPIKEKIWTCPQ